MKDMHFKISPTQRPTVRLAGRWFRQAWAVASLSGSGGSLPGTHGPTDAVFVSSVSATMKALSNNFAATSAGENGAINIWRDDAGKLRCHSMYLQQITSDATFNSMREVKGWVREWLPRIAKEQESCR